MLVKLEDARSQALARAAPKFGVRKGRGRPVRGPYKVPRGGVAPGAEPQGNVTCGESLFAPGRNRCPAECPFSMKDTETSCHFICVPENLCGSKDKRDDVADKIQKVCRPGNVVGCQRHKPKTDECLDCKLGYELVGTTCLSRFRHIWYALYVIAVTLGVILVSYIFDLVRRPRVNEAVLNKAMLYRSHCKLRDPDDNHAFYPVDTDLHHSPSETGVSENTGPIGGTGLLLHFNFQLAMILWCVFAILGWVLLGLVYGSDQFLIGTMDDSDPQKMCQAIRWGQAAQQNFAFGKFWFIFLLWVFSTLGCIAFAVYQHRRFLQLDASSATMMDYATIIHGFPVEAGQPGLEEEYTAFLTQALSEAHSGVSGGVRPVGVSVAWDYGDMAEQIDAQIVREVELRERDEPEHPHTIQEPAARGGCLSSAFRSVDALLGIGGLPCASPEEQAPEETGDDGRLAEVLKEMKTHGTLIAVFQSEADRDAAVETFSKDREGTLLFRNQYKLQAKKKFYEPESILWENMGVSRLELIKGTSFGIMGVLGAILVWGVCFYGPFAYYESATYAATGQGQGFATNMTFTILVVVGNQIMYQLCAVISEKIGFKYRDHREAAYTTLYTGAIFVNMLVDVGIVVYVAYLALVHNGVRTDEGVLLSELPDREAIFKSYPMQKTFGRTLYEYNFPACFLLPFLLEPVVTILLPYYLGMWLVRSRAVSRRDAEECLAPMPMDLARYGDLLINVMLVSMSLFLASGYVLWNLLGLLAGNLFIYLYDRYRVLRQVQSFCFSSGRMDRVAQHILIIPCGILAACLVYQLSVIGFFDFYASSWPGKHFGVWGLCGTALVLHIILHYSLLGAAADLWTPDDPETSVPYKEAAKHVPANWFSVNPVHCLRSKYIHGHTPPCMFYIHGKDHLIEKNEKIGLYYEVKKFADESISRAFQRQSLFRGRTRMAL